MNVKQIICVAKMFVIISRTCVVCVANLHDKGKSNMAVIVNKFYWASVVKFRISSYFAQVTSI